MYGAFMHVHVHALLHGQRCFHQDGGQYLQHLAHQQSAPFNTTGAMNAAFSLPGTF